MKNYLTKQLNKLFDKASASAKGLISLCAVLTLICVISVGFSGWIIINPNVSTTVEAQQFQVYSVSNSRDYIDILSVQGFKYSYKGFLNESDSYVATGEVTVISNFTAGNAEKFLISANQNNANGMNLTFTMYFLGENLPTVLPAATCEIGGKTVKCTTQENGDGDRFLRGTVNSKDLNLNNSAATLEVKFKLQFDDNFGYLYEFLRDNGKITIEAKITKA